MLLIRSSWQFFFQIQIDFALKLVWPLIVTCLSSLCNQFLKLPAQPPKNEKKKKWKKNLLLLFLSANLIICSWLQDPSVWNFQNFCTETNETLSFDDKFFSPWAVSHKKLTYILEYLLRIFYNSLLQFLFRFSFKIKPIIK